MGPGVLRPAARGVLMAGALGSTAFTIRAGRSAPRVLLFLIAIWVLVPFVAVSLVDAMSKRWSAASQLMVHAVMFVLAVVSLAIYGAELTRPHTPPAFMFVVVPPVLLLLVAVVSAAGAIISGRQSR